MITLPQSSAVSVIAAARMNSASYLRDSASLPEVPGWTREAYVEHPGSGLAVSRCRSNDGRLYLAVRGTSCVRDFAQNALVFLGQNPSVRMAAFMDYVQNTCTDALNAGTLSVGGHSLGGLVSTAAAAKWRLPGLVQNSPGWMVDAPTPDRLERMLEVRTCRDTISEWGSILPRTLTLILPQLSTFGISSLHSVELQNKELERAWFADVAVDDPGLSGWPEPPVAPVAPGLRGLPSRLSRSWNLLSSDLEQIRRHVGGEQMGGPPSLPSRGFKPR